MSSLNLNSNQTLTGTKSEIIDQKIIGIPTSIKWIAWLHIGYGVVLIIAYALNLTGLGKVNSTFFQGIFGVLITAFYGIAGMVFFIGEWAIILAGFVAVGLGYGLMSGSRVAWILLFSGSILGLLGLLSIMNLLVENLNLGGVLGFSAVVAPFWEVFLAWKLWQHRKIFGI